MFQHTFITPEVEDICKTIGVANINQVEVPKDEIEDAIFIHNYKETKEDINKCEKLEDVKHEDIRELPDYMMEKSVEKVRMAFIIRTKMVKIVKMNFKIDIERI